MLKQKDQEQHIYDYLSGVPITSKTKFFNLNNNETNLNMYKDLIYFFDYLAVFITKLIKNVVPIYIHIKSTLFELR